MELSIPGRDFGNMEAVSSNVAASKQHNKRPIIRMVWDLSHVLDAHVYSLHLSAFRGNAMVGILLPTLSSRKPAIFTDLCLEVILAVAQIGKQGF